MSCLFRSTAARISSQCCFWNSRISVSRLRRSASRRFIFLSSKQGVGERGQGECVCVTVGRAAYVHARARVCVCVCVCV